MKIKFITALLPACLFIALLSGFKTENSFRSEGNDSLQMYARFDFIPGEDLLYLENYSEDSPGEFPSGWNSNGSAALNLRGNSRERWLKLEQNGLFLTSNEQTFSEAFSVEFDLYLDFTFQNAFYPPIAFGLLNSENYPSNGNQVLSNLYYLPHTRVDINIGSEENSLVKLMSFQGGQEYLHSGEKSLISIEGKLKKVIHVSMLGQKERLRVWMDEEKIFDMPRAIPAGVIFNQLFFEIGESSYGPDDLGVYVTNIRIAKGFSPIAECLAKQGSWTSHGIRFDKNSAKLKPESYPVLRAIASWMKSNPDAKLEIVGHTDTDGESDFNQRLSEERSEAVKKALTELFAINKNRLTASGKGESAPLVEEKSDFDRENNRRVEFIKK